MNTLTLKEIKSHNNAKNCWIIVDAKVYDVTDFIAIHEPYCEKIKLTDYCGGDASTIWLDKQKSNHAHKRKSILEFERSQIGISAGAASEENQEIGKSVGGMSFKVCK